MISLIVGALCRFMMFVALVGLFALFLIYSVLEMTGKNG